MHDFCRHGLLVALICATAGGARGDDLESMLDSFTADSIARHIEVLASDEFEGRAPSTPGEDKTIAYIRDYFREVGVQPMPDGSYFQEVPLVSKRVTGTPVLELAGKGNTIELELGPDMILGTDRMQEQVSVQGCDVVFAGYGISAPEYGWDDYRELDVRDKIVLVVMNDPGRLSGDPDFFRGTALTLYGTTSHKQEQAAARGARGLILIHDEEIILYPWEALGANAHTPHFSAQPNENTPVKPELFVEIPRERAEQILSAVGQDYAQLVSESARPGFTGFSTGLQLSVEFEVEIEHSRSNNVIGIVPGSGAPDEYVLYTAHWDHVGIGEPEDGDGIYNGAVDNATGTAVLMELARAHAQLDAPPRRSVVFIATAAEEQGLLGAFHYTNDPVYPLENTMAVINMDALFPFGQFNAMTVVAMGSSEVEDYLGAAAALEGRVLQADSQPEIGAFFRSDHYPFAKRGVPAIFTVGGPASEPEPDAGMIERFQDYGANRYHHPSDEYDATWDMRGIVGDARIYFRTGLSIANDTRVPNWYLGSEFRALRDAGRARAAAER